jgi:hypothetical protein
VGSPEAQYLIRRVDDGTMRTVIARSIRGAIQKFVIDYKPAVDEDFAIKERMSNDPWEYYRVGVGGIRKVKGP